MKKLRFISLKRKEGTTIDVGLGIQYAERFALMPREKRLFYTAGDSDCTNFVSQCVWASMGGYIINDDTATKDNINENKYMIKGVWNGNGYGGTIAWENVEGFYKLFTGNGVYGVRSQVFNDNKSSSNLDRKNILLGDIIQVKKKGDRRYSHSAYVTKIVSSSKSIDIYVSQHSYNRLNRDINNLIALWGWEKCYIRVLRLFVE